MFFRNSTAPQIRSGTAASGRSTIPSLLSADICIKGDVGSDGEIQVDGVIEGDIVAKCLVVSEVGMVRGTIAAETVRILGTVTGTITAGSIRLARTARVTGDIVHEALSIEEGAFVLGHCRRAEPDRPAVAEGAQVSATSPDTCPDTNPATSTNAPSVECEPMVSVVPDNEDAAVSEAELTIPPLAR